MAGHISPSEQRQLVCDRRHWWGYVERWALPESSPWSAEGTAAHSHCEQMLRSRFLGGPMVNLDIAYDGVPDDRREHLTGLVDGFFNSDDWKNLEAAYEVVDVEAELRTKLPTRRNLALKTVIDVVLRHRKSGEILPLDWKFQAAFSDSIDGLWRSEQASAYIWAAQQHAETLWGGRPSGQMFFVFMRRKGTRNPLWQTVATHRTAAQLAAYVGRVTADAILADDARHDLDRGLSVPSGRMGDHCAMCDFAEPCKLVDLGLDSQGWLEEHMVHRPADSGRKRATPVEASVPVPDDVYDFGDPPF